MNSDFEEKEMTEVPACTGVFPHRERTAPGSVRCAFALRRQNCQREKKKVKKKGYNTGFKFFCTIVIIKLTKNAQKRIREKERFIAP